MRNYKNEEDVEKIELFGRISVGNTVHSGTNVIIMHGVRIGDNCIISCEAIITKDIPNNSITIGVLARVIETL